MDIGFIGLITLVVVIILAFVTKVNVGLLAIAASVFLGLFSDITADQIISGFDSNLFIMLLGILLLCTIAVVNGSLELFAMKLLRLTGGKALFAPIMIYFIGLIVSAMGPGAVPVLGIVTAVSIPLGRSTGYSTVMLAIIGEMGTFTGRFSPLTPESALIRSLAIPQGITGYQGPLLIYNFLTTIILAALIFFMFKGHKVNRQMEFTEDLGTFSKKQIITLIGFVFMILIVLIFGLDIGLIAFATGVILMLLGVADERKVLRSISWSTLIMVTGVGVLMNIIIEYGGVDILSNALSSVMTPQTSMGIQGLIAGILSWFSSAMGVVWPTLIPTVGNIAENVGVDPAGLITVMGLTASFAGLSPASTGGAMIMAAESTSSKSDGNRLFVKLFLLSVLLLITVTLFSFLGLYTIL